MASILSLQLKMYRWFDAPDRRRSDNMIAVELGRVTEIAVALDKENLQLREWGQALQATNQEVTAALAAAEESVVKFRDLARECAKRAEESKNSLDNLKVLAKKRGWDIDTA